MQAQTQTQPIDSARPFQYLYNTGRWKKLSRYQLAKEPLCRMCTAQGRIEPAVVADHIKPHRGNVNLFWLGELQSLCLHCHNATKQAAEQSNRQRTKALGHSLDVSSDGWPTDPRHPGNSGVVRSGGKKKRNNY